MLLDPDTRNEIEQEILYQQARRTLMQPQAENDRPWIGLGLLALATLFGLGALAWEWLRPAGLLALVLALHDLGHLLGMIVFRYRDAQGFLLPLLGTFGRSRGANHSATADAITTLLGPLPGLLLAAGLTLWETPPTHWATELAWMLAVVNGVSLIPMLPLDGGRFLDLLSWTRHPWPGTLLRLVVLAAVGIAVTRAGDWRLAVPLGIIAGLALLSVLLGHKLAQSRRALTDQLPVLPRRLEALTDAQCRSLFQLALRLFPMPDPPRLGTVMRVLHNRAAMTRMPRFVAAGLLVVYLSAVALAVWLAGEVI